MGSAGRLGFPGNQEEEEEEEEEEEDPSSIPARISQDSRRIAFRRAIADS